jgi:hypothetical protein
MTSSQTLRKRSYTLLCASIITATTGALFLGGMTTAQAGETPPSTISPGDISVSAAYYNGYYIDNNTNETLTWKSTVQPGGTKCRWALPFYACDAKGEGFGATPPQSIAPHTRAYFEIPVYVQNGTTSDSTTLHYETSEGKYTFEADVRFDWFEGVPYFDEDKSSCNATISPAKIECNTDLSQGRKTQTTFKLSSSS